MGEYEWANRDIMLSDDSTVFGRFKQHCSSNRTNTELFVLQNVRSLHPDKHVTKLAAQTANFLSFADAGHADIKLIRDDDNFARDRTYAPPRGRVAGGEGIMADSVSFGLYDFVYQDEKFLLYYIQWPEPARGSDQFWFILTSKDQVDGNGHSPSADKLIKTVGKWTSQLHEEIYVFDSSRWSKNHKLWSAIRSASWDDVILNAAMKETLIADVEDFFNSATVYKEYGVPWKRGIIFHGSPGCGKTISIKALMNSLEEKNVASLYVKSISGVQGQQGKQNSVRTIFQQARIMAPCMLIFEDLDSLVVDEVRSYFLNEVDGLEDNDGILMIGSTNHLERLDAGITKRPSRFDRKYHYKLPGERERILYCNYWRGKLQKNSKIEFDEEISTIVAQLTEGFSFAYLKELFVQTLLTIVGGRANVEGDDDDDAEVAVTDAAEKTKVADDSSKLLKEGQTLDSATPSTSQAEDATGKAEEKAEDKMPQVEIPERLQSNSLMRILHKQTKALRKEMDNTVNEIHSRPKLAGGDSQVAPRKLLMRK